MATIGEVAEQAGAGVGTVSRVLNTTGLVKQPARGRVFQAIHDLDFQPNQEVHPLFTTSTSTLGVVLPYPARPFLVTVFQWIEAMVATGYHLKVRQRTYVQGAITELLRSAAWTGYCSM